MAELVAGSVEPDMTDADRPAGILSCRRRPIDARLYSKFLAVQIKAQLDGILPAELPA